MVEKFTQDRNGLTEAKSRRDWMRSSVKNAFDARASEKNLHAATISSTTVEKDEKQKVNFSNEAMVDVKDLIKLQEQADKTHVDIRVLARKREQSKADGVLLDQYNEAQNKYFSDLAVAENQLVFEQGWAAKDFKISDREKDQLKAYVQSRVEIAKRQNEKLNPEEVMSEKDLKATIYRLQMESMAKPFKTAMEKAFYILDNLPPLFYKLFPVVTVLTLALIACSSSAPTPRPEVTGANTPQEGEVTGGSGTATEEGVATEATGMSAEDLAIINTIQNDPYYRNSAYAKAKEATSGIEIPQACVDMTNELIARGEISAVTFVEVGVTSSANCYVTWEENGIRTVVFNSKDINGYLYVLFNPAEHEVGAQFEYKNAPHALWAAIMVGGQATEGVNGATHQWVKLVDGQLTDANGVPTPVATSTPVNAPTGEAHPVGQTLDEAAIAKLVEDYNSGTLTDLSSLTAEQLKAFDSARMTTLVEKYENGDREVVNKLNFEQRKEFSIALDEKKKEQRGENPVIYTDKTGAKFYIDPISGKFLPVGNGTNAEQQTIDANAPRAIDDEGYTHIFYNGTWIKIEGSQNIQFDNFENFKWPAGEKVDPQWVPDPNLHNLTTPEYLFVAYGAKVNMVPIFFLEKELGEINIPGFGVNGTLLGYVVNGNDPFSVTALLTTGAPTLYGDNFSAGSTGDLGEVSHFYQKLQVNRAYYLMYEVDQKEEFAKTYPKSNDKEVTTDYQGLAPSSQTHDIITGKIKSNDLALVKIAIIVEPGK